MTFHTQARFLFFSWSILLQTVSNIQANEESNLSPFNVSAGFHEDQNMTFTNLKEISNETIGYQNPWEQNVDIEETMQRSQIKFLRWPRTGVPIFCNDNFAPAEKCLIRLAIERLNMYSCTPLKLFEVDSNCSTASGSIESCLMDGKTAWTAQKLNQSFGSTSLIGHIVIVKDAAICWSQLGYRGQKMILKLASFCFDAGFGTVIHETLHALGYQHEHNRLDRDDHVMILEQNIVTRSLRSFRKVDPQHFQDFGPYDLYSLMHYGSRAGVKSGSLRSIVAKNKTADFEFYRIGKREDLTDIDKTKVRAVTHCSGKTYEEHLTAVKTIDIQLKAKIKSGLIKPFKLRNKECSRKRV